MVERGSALLVGSAALLIAASILGLAVGSRTVAPSVVVDALVSYDATDDEHLVVVASRIPRIVLGVVVGACLGLAGALMQSLTRNPIADPGILGVNAGAALGVVGAIAILGVEGVGGYVWFAFAGAAVAAVVVYGLGSARGQAATPVRIALAGTAVTMAITAVTQMMVLSDEAAFNHFRYWSVGSLQGRGLDVIAAVGPFALAGVAVGLGLIRPLNALVLGEDAARSIGADPAVTRGLAAIAVVLLAGAATAAAGPFVFIGLAAAHIVRRTVGSDHRILLPASLLVGATLLVAADALGRALMAPRDLQSGLAAVLVGGPVFVALVRSRRVAAL
ncbi:iron ABC transporter permease [Gordonia iterans]|uniref:Iron ABC transporter permease n=1 Tax=Gordonia iterans TaxID=1004901 RepID=A0A2S0KKQ9_9ACTN|nr:iron ABC transporter permease [Gordonia iterans]